MAEKHKEIVKRRTHTNANTWESNKAFALQVAHLSIFMFLAYLRLAYYYVFNIQTMTQCIGLLVFFIAGCLCFGFCLFVFILLLLLLLWIKTKQTPYLTEHLNKSIHTVSVSWWTKKRRLTNLVMMQNRGEQSICMVNGRYGVYSTIGTNNRSNSKLYIHKTVRLYVIFLLVCFSSLTSSPSTSLFRSLSLSRSSAIFVHL